MKLTCYVEYKDQYWTATCLDLSLEAVGKTAREAVDSLDKETAKYINDSVARNGALILRPAPLHMWIEYRWFTFKQWIRSWGW